jgi:hypothetical protein
MARGNAVLSGPDAKWRAEQDMRTLIEAEEIRSDKKRFQAAARMAKKKAEEMESAFNLEPGEKET